MSETLEHTARRIAEHGREALLARLRPAFREAAAAHRDTLTLDDEALERMVQRAADKADGLQWRRALASVATEQLGIGLGEALSHPAVARAQAIVGAPSYEEALGSLGAKATAAPPPQEPAPAPPGEPAGHEQEPAEEHEEADAHEEEPAEEHEQEPAAHGEEDASKEHEEDAAAHDEEGAPEEHEEAAAEAEETTEPEPPAPVAAESDLLDDEPDEEADGVRLRAIHLGGIANLAPAEGDLELHISSVGLDIVRGPDQSVLGRLSWPEIDALETPELGGRFRRKNKKQADAHLVVRSPAGSASFEIPGVTSAELREHIAPLIAQHK